MSDRTFPVPQMVVEILSHIDKVTEVNSQVSYIAPTESTTSLKECPLWP